MEVGLGPQVADSEPEDGEAVEPGDDALLKRQQTRQVVEFAIQPQSVPLARVRLGWVLHLLLHIAANIDKKKTSKIFQMTALKKPTL